ncbi:MAG: ester cyclase [Candidatus Marinimicrobia bacterium]|nr:ester cyclase [Candidatus Neomarinimicrobiota bacterium]
MKMYKSILIFSILILGCTMQNNHNAHKQLVDKYVQYWNTGDFSGIEDVLHPEFELITTPTYQAKKGIESFKEVITNWRTAYPDFSIILDEEIYGNNDGAVRWTITATHTGKGSMPPTGKHINVKGLSIFHIEDNKIKDEWIAGNDLHWLRQLGFTLTPPS